MALEYFHLREEEYAILTMLDGRTSLDQLRQRIRSHVRAAAAESRRAARLSGHAASLWLVLAESPGQGQQLLVRQTASSVAARYETLLGVLAIRFRGVNPARLLDWLYPKCALAVFAAVAWRPACWLRWRP